MSGLGWNVVDDARQLLAFHFMLNALRAGTIVAVVAGAIGYFMVLRRQAFAGHTLAVVGFPGAAGATYLGLAHAVRLLRVLRRRRAGHRRAARRRPRGWRQRSRRGGGESAAVGTVQAFALACGFLFVSLYHGFLTGLNSLLFGTIIGVTDDQVLTLLVAGVLCLAVLALLGRPLLFASIDPDVARARGLPVRLLGAAFLVLLGVAAAGTSQVTGSLLVFALLVAPAATAARLTARPGVGLALSVGFAVLVTWVGEGVAFFSPYPIGFWVTTFAFGLFVLAAAYRAGSDALGRRRLHAAGAADDGRLLAASP